MNTPLLHVIYRKYKKLNKTKGCSIKQLDYELEISIA